MATANITVQTPLCLTEAWSAWRNTHLISEEEYHYHALAHLAGVVHDADVSDDQKLISCLARRDCFLYAIRDVAKEIQPIQDVAVFESIIALFAAYREGNLEQLKRLHDSLDPYWAPHIRRILASRALEDMRPDILKACLDIGGFKYDTAFIFEARWKGGSMYPEMYAAMEGTEFRRLHPWEPSATESLACAGIW